MDSEDVQVGDKLMCYSGGEPQMINITDVDSGTPILATYYALELDSSLGVLASYFADDILVCV